MINQVTKFTATITLIGYLFLALFSLFNFSFHMHSDIQMQNCPYAFGTHSLCPMNTLEHIQAWKDATTIILPSIIFLVIVAGSFSLWGKRLEIRPSILFLRRRLERQYSPYTFLFSEGILNSKAP